MGVRVGEHIVICGRKGRGAHCYYQFDSHSVLVHVLLSCHQLRFWSVKYMYFGHKSISILVSEVSVAGSVKYLCLKGTIQL